MPKKKIIEEVPQEISEKGEAGKATELTDIPPEEAASETVAPAEGSRGMLLKQEKEQSDEYGTEIGHSFLLSSIAEDEAPDIVSVKCEGEPYPEMADEVETNLEIESEMMVALTSEVPYGVSFTETLNEEATGENTSEETGHDADRGETDIEEAIPESSAPMTESALDGSAGEKTTGNPEDRTAGEERRAFYGLDFNELDRDLSPEQRQEWNSIYASYRGHNAMSGTIVGIDRHRLRVRDRKTGEMTSQQLYCAIVIPFRVRILIPETELWMRGEERPDYVIRNLAGAKIDFVIIHVDREAGFAVGSRRLAIPSRRYYFSTQPSMNAPGSRVSCDVLVVGPRRCLVSCHGYDVDLSQRELSYTAIPDLREIYHSGQTLNCVVKAYDRESGRLSVSVKETVPNPYDGAEFRHPVQSHRQGVIAGKYGGGVFCNLSDGVTVMCNYSFHYDDASFRSGDRVMLIIQRYDNQKKQVYGKIVAKC